MLICITLSQILTLAFHPNIRPNVTKIDEKEVKEALDLADPDVITGRTRRLKRAIDLSFKRKNMMDYAPEMNQETFKEEIYDDVKKIITRDQEYAQLNAHNK